MRGVRTSVRRRPRSRRLSLSHSTPRASMLCRPPTLTSRATSSSCPATQQPWRSVVAGSWRTSGAPWPRWMQSKRPTDRTQ
jgi:hypothetical protein